jgi:hypothetical protein
MGSKWQVEIYIMVCKFCSVCVEFEVRSRMGNLVQTNLPQKSYLSQNREENWVNIIYKSVTKQKQVGTHSLQKIQEVNTHVRAMFVSELLRKLRFWNCSTDFIKFGILCLYQNFSEEFDFDLYRSNITPIFFVSETELCLVSKQRFTINFRTAHSTELIKICKLYFLCLCTEIIRASIIWCLDV